jgi:hypothetical protein
MVRGRKAGELEWTKEAEASFQNLKTAFTQAPILIHFDPSKKVRVETDASGFALAGKYR